MTKIPHENADQIGLSYAVNTLENIGRLDSVMFLREREARANPTAENCQAWLESAQRMYRPNSANAAWEALNAQLEAEGQFEKRDELRKQRQRFFSTRPDGVLRVAGIMDEFTTASFRPECAYLPLSPELYIKQLENFKPDLVFIESAWHGNEETWSRMVSTVSDQLREVLTWCRENNVPSVFWNKEDPVHFSGFLEAAGLCDFVFTTDMDCIPAYKDALGHDRVYLLPFAAQPQQHNPIVTMERKDAFNFAGSYYLRYPERQRDIAAILDTVKELRAVDIYDRNHGKDHPHYQFPEEYQSMILGRLPFSEIDKAYKGYRYGINMNTIKQSQTMFARRVYELMASNTVVVSNFSRGVRMLFGDLVICSDKREQLRTPLAKLAEDDLRYRKFRLQGLRKVMREHTYSARLDYIVSKIRGEAYEPVLPGATVLAHAHSATEAKTLTAAFQSQTHPVKHMFLLLSGSAVGSVSASETISVFEDAATLRDDLDTHPKNFPFWGVMHSADHYGANYLTDLVLTSRYSDAEGFGKACAYALEAGKAVLKNAQGRYYTAATLPLRAALLRRTHLTPDMLQKALSAPDTAEITDLPMLGIDEFNYCRDGHGTTAVMEQVDDLDLPFQGLPTAELYATAENMAPAKARLQPRTGSLPVLTAKSIFSGSVVSQSMPLVKGMKEDELVVTRQDETPRPYYLWMRKKYSRKALGLLDQSMLSFDIAHDMKQAHLVVELYTASGTKISHSMLGSGGSHALAIPGNCTQLRFGLRLLGSGQVKVSDIVFGEDKTTPPAIVGSSDTLVLTKQYPAYDDLYKYGFLHSRIRAYQNEGVGVDVFRLNTSEDKIYREFEDVDVASGDAELLDATLALGRYKHVLVHLLDRQMWEVLKKHVDKVKVTIWLHGAEIQAWQRRAYEFPTMKAADIERQKKLSANRMRLWKEVFSTPTENLHYVSVSQNFMDEVEEDVGLAPAKKQVSIIHNFIDGNVFAYTPKRQEGRKRVLSIRPYASKKYANDLSAAAIVALSTRPCFKDMEFMMVGDGDLFDEITAPLTGFSNVTLHRGFMSHAEIAALHKSYGIFLTPTRMDSQGVSRDEAMSSGLVPVTSRVAAIPEFVDDACGFMAPDEGHLELANAIEVLYNDPDRFVKMSAAAAKRVRMQSGFDQTIAREIALI